MSPLQLWITGRIWRAVKTTGAVLSRGPSRPGLSGCDGGLRHRLFTASDATGIDQLDHGSYRHQRQYGQPVGQS
jgi:hypothetical protein